jgi:hypothetical protein
MVEPSDQANRFLLWIKIVQTKRPYLKVTIGRDRLAELYDLSENRVTELVGIDRRFYAEDSAEELMGWR